MLSTIIAIDRIEVNTLIEPLLHPAFNDGLQGFNVVRTINADVLNMATLRKMETFKFLVLLLKGRQIFVDVAVEGISEVFRAVMRRMTEHIVHANVLAPLVVLLRLRTTKGFSGCAIDGIQIAVFVLVLVNLGLDVL